MTDVPSDPTPPDPTTPPAPAAPPPPAPPPPPSFDLASFEVPASALRWTCDPHALEAESAAELPFRTGIIGQERAIDALQLGFRIRSRGHNVFVCGPPGFGRTTTVRHVLETLDSGRGRPPDVVFVNNFTEPDRPVAIQLGAGRGRIFREEMLAFVEAARRALARLSESDELDTRRHALSERTQSEQASLWRPIGEQAAAAGLALVEVESGGLSHPDIVPLAEGAPIAWPALEDRVASGKLTAADAQRLRSAADALLPSLREAAKRTRAERRQYREALLALEIEAARPLVDDALEDVRERLPEPEIARYLGQVREEVLRDLQRFVDPETTEEAVTHPRTLEEDERYRPFLVNVVVDNSQTVRPPIVVETSPSHRNLFGTIERVTTREGLQRSDFLHIKGGSFLRANGGFLVIDLADVIADPPVWAAIKRTLRNRKVEIGGADSPLPFTPHALEPEPVPIDVRAVVLGDSFAYHTLYNFDPDFRKIFKVKAEFDSVMPRDDTGVHRYAGFIHGLVEAEGLRAPDRAAIALVVEHGARLAGQAGKLSTRFSDLADLLREASYWAERMELPVVTRAAVQRAIDEHRRRLRLPEEKLHELMVDGTLHVQTHGHAVGQVNGLSVYDMGDYAFGKPTRITAQSSLGQSGILSIEREAELSGRSFNKATLILEGFFRARFGQDVPLNLTASIAFEQSYGEVEGDSASLAEIAALVSSLSEFPLRQDLAITGSVDQHGRVQPIGGADEKIEGFFELCVARGLDGTHGVVIPRTNVPDLMLREDVVQAVRAGQFHVHAVERVEEALELLSGVGIGTLGPDGLFTESSIYGRVQDKLHFYAERMKEFGKGDAPAGEGGGEPAVPGPHPPKGLPPDQPPGTTPDPPPAERPSEEPR